MPQDLLASQNIQPTGDNNSPVQQSAPKDLLAGSDTPQPTSADSKVVSAASGFNQGVENMTLGSVQLASLITDKLLGTDTTSAVGKVKANLEEAQNQFKDANPGTFAAGKFAGTVGAIAPTLLIPGAGGMNALKLGSQGFAQGAMAGALMYDQSDSLMGHLVNSAVSGTMGGLIGGAFGAVKDIGTAATNIVGTYAKGLQAGQNSAKGFIQDVTNGVSQVLNPGSMETSAKNVMDNVESAFKNVQAQKNSLYSARDVAAAKSGINVSTDNVNSVISDFKSGMGTRPNPDEATILKSISSFGGTDSVSVGEAYNLMKRAGTLRQDFVATDPTKARMLGQIQTGFGLDINKAIDSSGNTTIQQLHNDAESFYKGTYLPIQQVARSKAIDALTDDAWVSKLVSQAKTSSVVNTALNQIGGDIKNQLAQAHMNAVKSSLTDPVTGTLDFGGYVKALSGDLQKNPAFSAISGQIGNLSDVVDLVKKVQGLPSTGLTTTAAGMAAISGHIPAAGMALLGGQLPKAKAMYALGKMLDTPEVSNLVNLAGNSAKSASEPMQQALSTRILSQVGSIMTSKTMDRLGKALTIGGVTTSAMNSQSVLNGQPPEPMGFTEGVGIRD